MTEEELNNDSGPEEGPKNEDLATEEKPNKMRGITILDGENISVLSNSAIKAVVSGSATGLSEPEDFRLDERGVFIEYREYPPQENIIPGTVVRASRKAYLTGKAPEKEELREKGESKTKEAVVPYEKAYDLIVGSTAGARTQLELIYAEKRAQALMWDYWSIRGTIVGFLTIIIGVILILFDQFAPGGLTFVVGAVTEGVAFLFFRQSKLANDRVDIIQGQLSNLTNIETTFHMVNTISNEEERNSLMKWVVARALGENPF